MLGINITKAVQKKKIEKVAKDDLRTTKKSNKKTDREKVKKTFPKNEYVIFHTGKKESNVNQQETKSFSTNEKAHGSRVRVVDEIKEVKPEFSKFTLEETPLPPHVLSFPRITLEESLSGKKTYQPPHSEISTFDFLKPENLGDKKPLAWMESEVPFITPEQIPECGGKFGKMRIYRDNTAELEVNGVIYEIRGLPKGNMEIYAISPHPSDVAFEISSLGKVEGRFKIGYPREKF